MRACDETSQRLKTLRGDARDRWRSTFPWQRYAKTTQHRSCIYPFRTGAYDITESTEAAILSLMIHVEWADLPGDAALHLIGLD
jgi:hypothetical protein